MTELISMKEKLPEFGKKRKMTKWTSKKEILAAIKAVRAADCGAWMKDCSGLFHCSEGREKRQELSRLLDQLYKAAGV